MCYSTPENFTRPWYPDNAKVFLELAHMKHGMQLTAFRKQQFVRLPAVGTLKRYSKTLEYEYRIKTAALGTLKRYSILSPTLYLE
jgi:hypothetical protein